MLMLWCWMTHPVVWEKMLNLFQKGQIIGSNRGSPDGSRCLASLSLLDTCNASADTSAACLICHWCVCGLYSWHSASKIVFSERGLMGNVVVRMNGTVCCSDFIREKNTEGSRDNKRSCMSNNVFFVFFLNFIDDFFFLFSMSFWSSRTSQQSCRHRKVCVLLCQAAPFQVMTWQLPGSGVVLTGVLSVLSWLDKSRVEQNHEWEWLWEWFSAMTSICFEKAAYNQKVIV